MILYTVYTLIRVYISVMQIGYIAQEKNKEAVLMSPDKYRVAGEYAIKKERLNLVSTIVDLYNVCLVGNSRFCLA